MYMSCYNELVQTSRICMVLKSYGSLASGIVKRREGPAFLYLVDVTYYRRSLHDQAARRAVPLPYLCSPQTPREIRTQDDSPAIMASRSSDILASIGPIRISL